MITAETPHQLPHSHVTVIATSGYSAPHSYQTMTIVIVAALPRRHHPGRFTRNPTNWMILV